MTNKSRINISGKVVAIIIVFLVMVIVVSAYINLSGNNDDADGYVLTVSVVDENGSITDLRTYTINEIKDMPSVDVYAKLQSSQNGDEEGTFTGVALKYILNHTDRDILKEYKTFILSAGDGYSSAASQKEVKNGNAVIIAYAKDGKDLEHFNEGGLGPMKAVFTKDVYGNRSTGFLVKVTCK